jgi:hypothetical protein
MHFCISAFLHFYISAFLHFCTSANIWAAFLCSPPLKNILFTRRLWRIAHCLKNILQNSPYECNYVFTHIYVFMYFACFRS